MGLLDKLWDDTVAGPRPDTGLGRLRKPPTLRVDVDDLGGAYKDSAGVCSSGPATPDRDQQMSAGARVTRSIKIRRHPQSSTSGIDATGGGTPGSTPPVSPATPPPTSPFAGDQRGGFGVRGGRRVRDRFPPRRSTPSSSSVVAHGKACTGVECSGGTQEEADLLSPF